MAEARVKAGIWVQMALRLGDMDGRPGAVLRKGDPDAGGVLCAACAPRYPDAVPLGESTFRVLRFLQTREWAIVRQLDLTPATRGSLERVMHAYIRHLLERDLNSVTFLKGLRRVAEPFGLRP